MDNLPHDILAQIFLYTPLWPKQRLAICAVSRRLRCAALDTPQLWSSIYIGSPRDLGHVPIFLAHSGDALLDVSVLPYGQALIIELRVSPMPFDADRLVAALLPHATRLRSLTVYLHHLAPLAPLLSTNLTFEHLKKLVVQGGDDFRISLSAPQLQVVDVSSMNVEDLAALAPRPRDLIMNLTFTKNVQRFMDELVSNGSQTLRRLTLHRGLHNTKSAPLVGPWSFPHLQFLDLSCTSACAVDMLPCVPTSHIPYVRVGLTDRIDYERDYGTRVFPALARLLVDVRNITEFYISGSTECSVMSSTGLERAFELQCSHRSEALHHIWSYLCDHFDARYTVSACKMSTSVQSLYQRAFKGKAPAAPEFTLRVQGSYGSRYSHILELPTLSKVALLGNSANMWYENTSRLADHKAAVLRLANGILACDRSDVELCTCDISCLSERGTELALREWVLQECGIGGSLTAEAGCVIRWILCSGNCVKS